MNRARVYRIDLAIAKDGTSEWLGLPWAFDVTDADAPTRRLDGAPELVLWGYAESQPEAFRGAVEALESLQ